MAEPPYKLDIAIIGAGLGGLAAAMCLGRRGHRIRVFESNRELSELGAGIQIPPNAMRILDSWGLADGMEELGAKPSVQNLRRFSNGQLIGHQRRNMKEVFGFECVFVVL